MRRMHSRMAAAALPAVGALVLLGLAFALSGSRSTAAPQDGNTALAQNASVGDELEANAGLGSPPQVLRDQLHEVCRVLLADNLPLGNRARPPLSDR